MTEDSKPSLFDASAFHAELAEAEGALAAFAQGPARAAADDISDAFDRAGQRIGAALGAAATGGEAAMKRLAKTILEELARIALSSIFEQGAKGLSGFSFYGARAAGGSVTRGGAYLVGERGPELFTPASTGAIGAGAAPVNVHFHLAAGADGPSLMRHQGQIAAQIARAVAYGRRNL